MMCFIFGGYGILISTNCRPYLIDLDSANGTFLNKEEIPQGRYIELREKDMIQFGDSKREYLVIVDK